MIDTTRYPRLSRIQTPDDLRRFDEAELTAIAEELRSYLIESVGKSGGHFAAGLGVIELTVALHYLYQTPVDQLVWDVGHQTYPHKILTGRRDQIHTVKQRTAWRRFPSARKASTTPLALAIRRPRFRPRSAWPSPRSATATTARWWR